MSKTIQQFIEDTHIDYNDLNILIGLCSMDNGKNWVATIRTEDSRTHWVSYPVKTVEDIAKAVDIYLSEDIR